MPPPGPSSGFGGWPVVKNGFEIKNAVRVLLEGNIVENAWGGFSQVGYGFLFTPKSQSGLCPGCILTDVTARYNQGKHLGGGILFSRRTPTQARPARVLSANPSMTICLMASTRTPPWWLRMAMS